MNEQQFADEVRKALDETAERLPYRVTHRLQAARQAALLRMPRIQAQVALVGASAGSKALSVSDVDDPGSTRPLWWRAVVATLPVLLIVLGLAAITLSNEFDVADEMADVDLALLTDDVPISAFADRGFGVFVKNNGRQ